MNPLALAIEQSWQRRGLLAWLLSPLALVFRALATLRRCFYAIGLFKSEALPIPVIVVGNITVGGSGKTPLVIALVKALQDAGLKPGMISRGYGGSYSDQQPCAQVDTSDAQRYGDEAVLLAQKTGAPVFVGRKRVAAGQLLLQQFPDTNVMICDDGLQHYALKRNVELALFDERGLGNGWLLPAGPLREPVSRLAKVDAVVLNSNMPLASSWVAAKVLIFQMQLIGEKAYRLTQPADYKTLSDFKGQKLVAAAGIGNPQRFFRMLRGAHLEFEEMPLPDHYGFDANPFTSLDVDAILITEKDAVKCKALNDPRLWVVPVQAELDPALMQLIMQRLSPLLRTEKPIGLTPA